MLGATIIDNRADTEAAHQYDYRETIVASQKVNWRIEDIIGGDKKLDFSKRFMPESLARVEELSVPERRRKESTQPDPRACIPFDLRPCRGVHSPLRDRPRAADAGHGRLPGPCVPAVRG